MESHCYFDFRDVLSSFQLCLSPSVLLCSYTGRPHCCEKGDWEWLCAAKSLQVGPTINNYNEFLNWSFAKMKVSFGLEIDRAGNSHRSDKSSCGHHDDGDCVGLLEGGNFFFVIFLIENLRKEDSCVEKSKRTKWTIWNMFVESQCGIAVNKSKRVITSTTTKKLAWHLMWRVRWGQCGHSEWYLYSYENYEKK